MSRAAVIWLLVLAALPVAAQEDGPRTGYFRVHTTPLDLLGKDGARSLSEMFELDEKLEWQLYVPTSYDPTRPAGVMVFLTHSNTWGGSRREYNPALEEANLIWAAGKPELFKGGLFIGGAVAWGDELPSRIDDVRKNAYVFVAGSNDVALNTVRKAAIAFREAGVERTELIVMPNQRQEMPGRKYLLDAIGFLDGKQSD